MKLKADLARHRIHRKSNQEDSSGDFQIGYLLHSKLLISG